MDASQRSLLEDARRGSAEAAGALLEKNGGLVWSVARRYFGRGVEPEDLYQLGCLGFLKAVRGFDPEFGTAFSTYAVPKIAGEIRRFLRDDGDVKVSRTVKEQAQTLFRARARLEQQLGRQPTLTELSRETGLPPEEIAACETAVAPAERLQQEQGREGFTLEQVLSDPRQEEALEDHLALRQAVAALPERERRVLALRYWHGLTQQECARVLGVSQVQVSRVERRAVETLRRELQ